MAMVAYFTWHWIVKFKDAWHAVEIMQVKGCKLKYMYFVLEKEWCGLFKY